VAAVLSRTHLAEVPSGTAPTAVAAGVHLAEVVAAAPYAIAVAGSPDADIVAAAPDTAVSVGASLIADVGLAGSDHLVPARPQEGGDRDRQRVEHLQLVPSSPQIGDYRAHAPRGAANDLAVALSSAAVASPVADVPADDQALSVGTHPDPHVVPAGVARDKQRPRLD
jgi:hypothetical protein